MCERTSFPRGRDVALHKAVRSRDYCSVKELVDEGANVNYSLGGTTPLIQAVRNNMTRTVVTLLEAGADVNMRDRDSSTALMYAAQQADNSLLRLLTGVGAHVNVYVNSKWDTSFYFPGPRDEQLILRDIVLNISEGENFKNYIMHLMKSGANVNIPDRSGRSALFYAVEFNPQNYKCVQTLLHSGADVNIVNKNGDTAMSSAIRYIDNKTCHLLLNAGADVNLGHPLHTAITLIGDLSCVSHSHHTTDVKRIHRFFEILMTRGADVNTVNQRDQTPLMCAAQGQSLNLVKDLLKANVLINKTDTSGENALTLACTARWRLNSSSQQVAPVLFAAGESLGGDARVKYSDEDPNSRSTKHFYLPESLVETDLSMRLLPICRQVIRKHLLSLDPHKHLFNRIPELGLPSILKNYLLFDVSLDEHGRKCKED